MFFSLCIGSIGGASLTLYFLSPLGFPVTVDFALLQFPPMFFCSPNVVSCFSCLCPLSSAAFVVGTFKSFAVAVFLVTGQIPYHWQYCVCLRLVPT